MINKLEFQQQTGGKDLSHRKNPYLLQIDALLEVFGESRNSGPRLITAMAIVRQCKGFQEDLKRRAKTSRKQEAIAALHDAALAMIVELRGSVKREATLAAARAKIAPRPAASRAIAYPASAPTTSANVYQIVPAAAPIAVAANSYAANVYGAPNEPANPAAAPVSSPPAPSESEDSPYDFMGPELSPQDALQRNVGAMRRFTNLMTPGAGGRGSHKGLDKHYWLEAMDPKHRLGHGLAEIFGDWESANTNLNFYDWVDQVWLAANPNSTTREDVSFAGENNQVQYLTTEEERQEYELVIRGGKFISRLNGEPFDTTNRRTVWSGRGVAIFVASMDRRLFSATHVLGDFHHSSFLAGTPVQCGGEWVIHDGMLVLISNKSGHYKPGPSEFRRLLFVLRSLGVNLLTVTALWPWPGRGNEKFYNAHELLIADYLEDLKEPLHAKRRGAPLEPLKAKLKPRY